MTMVLRLYVNGSSASSRRALANAQGLVETCPDHVVLEVVDIREQPAHAVTARILAVPVLVRVSPEPVRKVIGDLSDLEPVRHSLGLQHASTAPAKEPHP
jgi:circadian clock protein KaiB